MTALAVDLEGNKEVLAARVCAAARASGLLLRATLLMACLIEVARISVGMHYPRDILGGAFDGLLAALLVTLLRRWLRQPTDAVLRFAYVIHLA